MAKLNKAEYITKLLKSFGDDFGYEIEISGKDFQYKKKYTNYF